MKLNRNEVFMNRIKSTAPFVALGISALAGVLFHLTMSQPEKLVSADVINDGMVMTYIEK
jgi:uncharacterized protein YpuA (DUF1002 family)